MKFRALVYAVSLLSLSGWAHSVHPQISPKPLRSFLVTEVMSSPEKGSPYLRTWTTTRAVREDGSWVRISIGAPPIQNERDIYDFRSGVQTIVEDTTKSVVRRSITVGEYKNRLAPAVSCEGTPAGQILGLSVNYREETYQITGNEQGDATALVKSWAAPDLGCFVLQKQTIWTRNTDGLLLVDTKITAISISFRAVDEFFDVPTSYTERTREEVWSMLEQLAATAAPLRGANDSRSTEK